jgi:methionine synthase II (cobalamin-independent)
MRSDLVAAVIIAAQHQTDSRAKAFTDELEMLKSSGLKYVAVRETLLSMLIELSQKLLDSAAATLIDDLASSSYDIDKKYADDVRATIETVEKEAREDDPEI